MIKKQEKSPLRRIRKFLKITQFELANHSGVSQAYISEMESGLIPIDDKVISFLVSIKQIMDKDIDNLEILQKNYMKEKYDKFGKKFHRKLNGKIQ